MSVLEEKEFGKILTSVVRSAREQGNTITGKEVEEAFASLHLNETQMKEIFSYLKSHRIGVDETPDLTADLPGVSYLSSGEKRGREAGVHPARHEWR